MEKVLYTKDREETITLGEQIGSLLFEPSLVLLEGDLGAGKTTITKGIAKGLGIKSEVTSPTFTLMKIYDHKLFHFDFYRSTAHDFDLYDYIDEHICVIEWPIYDNLPDEYLKIVISGEDENKQFVITSYGKKYDSIVEVLK